MREENNNSTDTAIDAINALSTLDSKWNVPQKKKRTKRKRRRGKKRGNPSNNSDQTNKLDASEMHNVWIDVEDVVKILNPSQSSTTKQGVIEDSGTNLKGSDVMDFPPLNSETKGEEQDLTAMDTSELKSYADVLTKALGGEASKNPSSNDDGSEMDISDDEESSADTPGLEIEHKSSPEDVSKETTTPDLSAATKSKAEEDDVKREKEKRALKLAELKAKAKLANAKLRMALQRKEAMGNTPRVANASLAAANINGRSTPTYNASTHQTKRPWNAPASNVSALRDVSALRNIRTLTIPDVSLTGADDMVRFIDSVYNLSSSEDEESSEGDGEEEDKPILEASPKAEVVLSNNNESQKKSHQSLKQQLQLAKLRLEIKRKEQLLLEKKRKMPVVAMTAGSKLPLNDMPSTADLTNASGEVCNDNSEGKAKSVVDESDVVVSLEEKKVKLEQLRQRQKELKQKNEVSNLKNLINRQRQLLRTQGQELSESSAQLESVVRDIKSKQTLLDESNKRLEEMNHRKKIMEGMMLRATQKLMTARKALSEHKQKSATT